MNVLNETIDKIDKNIDHDFYLFITGRGHSNPNSEKFAFQNYVFFKVKFLWIKIWGICLYLCPRISEFASITIQTRFPMKVVDMFGAALAVLAHNFETYFTFIEITPLVMKDDNEFYSQIKGISIQIWSIF